MIIAYHFSCTRSSATSKLVLLISSPVSHIPIVPYFGTSLLQIINMAEDKTSSLSIWLKVECDFTVKTPSIYVNFFSPDVAQSDLETVIPKAQDAHVRVVRGPNRGQVRTIFLFILPSISLDYQAIVWLDLLLRTFEIAYISNTAELIMSFRRPCVGFTRCRTVPKELHYHNWYLVGVCVRIGMRDTLWRLHNNPVV